MISRTKAIHTHRTAAQRRIIITMVLATGATAVLAGCAGAPSERLTLPLFVGAPSPSAPPPSHTNPTPLSTPTPTPTQTPTPTPTPTPAPTPSASHAPQPTAGYTYTGLTYEEFAVEVYQLWYPDKSVSAVKKFVSTNNLGSTIASQAQTLCDIAATSPQTTVTPQLSDGHTLTDAQLAAYRKLAIANFCPSVK